MLYLIQLKKQLSLMIPMKMNNYSSAKRVDNNKLDLAIQTLAEDLNFYQVFEELHIPRKQRVACPFHDENIPSFNVDYENNRFYCFSCKRGGNIVRFLNHYSNEIDKKRETTADTVNRLLKLNPDIASKCGFTSVYENRTEILRMAREGKLPKVKFHKPVYVPVDTFTQRAKTIEDVTELLAFYSKIESGATIASLQGEEEDLKRVQSYAPSVETLNSDFSLFELENLSEEDDW